VCLRWSRVGLGIGFGHEFREEEVEHLSNGRCAKQRDGCVSSPQRKMMPGVLGAFLFWGMDTFCFLKRSVRGVC